jgi:secondary thiamine-phosphate synthase enzyme
MVQTKTLQLSTRGDCDVQDITANVQSVVAESGLQNGMVTLFTPSSTSALTTLEFESGAVADLRRALNELAPPDRDYQHNLRWGDGNGHAHLRAALLRPSLTIPVVDSQLTLGTWQQVIFLDFDVRPRRRQIVVQLMGDPA